MVKTAEAAQRVRDWIEVRESLLSRVKSFDANVVSDRNVRSMYAHLLVALRRATITLIRLIAENEKGDGTLLPVEGTEIKAEWPPCFMWKRLNYLSKVCYDTEFLGGMTELENYFGVTFRNNPLAAEETLAGEDAQLEIDNLDGTRWNSPPRRRIFFNGLDNGTVKFVYGLLRQVQAHGIAVGNPDACADTEAQSVSLKRREETRCNDCVNDLRDARLHGPKDSSRPDPSQKQEFLERMEARRQRATLAPVVREWVSLTVKLRKLRLAVDIRCERRKKVRDLASQREFTVALARHVSPKQRDRLSAEIAFDNKRKAAARAVIAAMRSNLGRGKETERAAKAVGEKNTVAAQQRAMSEVINTLRQTCVHAGETQQRAEEKHAEVLKRLAMEAFGAWATAAGLAGCLRKRLGRADRALSANVISAWALFSRHSAGKRAQKQQRIEDRKKRARLRAWDTEILDTAFSDWANATAAGKFRRLRLSTRTLRGWRQAARAPAAGAVRFRLSQAEHEARLAAATKEADERIMTMSRRRLLESFESWARGAGLACRMRRQLARAEVALLKYAFHAWVMFGRHSSRQRETKAAARAAARMNAETLRAAALAWADLTAAHKFCRLRLEHKVFVAWEAAVLTSDR